MNIDTENLFTGIALDVDDLAIGLWHQELNWSVTADALCRQVLRLSGFNDRWTHFVVDVFVVPDCDEVRRDLRAEIREGLGRSAKREVNWYKKEEE